MIGTLFKMVTALGAVLLVFGVCVWGFRKMQSKLSLKKDGNKGLMFEVISHFALGPQKSLYMVRVEDKKLLLGVTSSSINILSDWDDFDSASGGAFRSSMSSVSDKTEIRDSASFAEQLSSSFKGVSRV